MYRIGIGYDIHRLKKGRPLMLGGVRLPFAMGLDGHSDADALLHAIIDALLGAAGLPDIGSYFPPGDPKTRNIPSRKMVLKAMEELRKHGYRVVNVDSVIIAEAPRLAPHREHIRKTVASLLEIPPADVQLKGKTHEGLDALGKRKAIAVHAVVLLQKGRS
jgi:2-C-methyl-D-erythritol 2,4-cyclodiphosphate synthase